MVSDWMYIRQLLVIILLNVLYLNTCAASPQSISYQGYLVDNNGVAVNEILKVTFKLYDVSTGGTALWSETNEVSVSNGLFTVKLGSLDNPLPRSSFKNQLWLGTTVNPDQELSPRQQLDVVASAMHASDADTVGGMTPAQLMSGTSSLQKGITIYTGNSFCGNDKAISLEPTCRTHFWHSYSCGFSSCKYYYDCDGVETTSPTPYTCPAVIAGYLVQ